MFNKSRIISFLVTITCMFGIVHSEIKPISKPIKTTGSIRTYIIDREPQSDLAVDVYFPPHWEAGQSNAVIVLEHGMGGNTLQFKNEALYLASRGIVAIAGERAEGLAAIVLLDCKSTVRWVRMNAKTLGIDPSRVIGAGGSGGAGCMTGAAFNDSEPEGEDFLVSSRPNALVFYYPNEMLHYARQNFIEWAISKEKTPTIFFYGTNDSLMSQGLEVATYMASLQNPTEFYIAEGQGHGFTSNRNGSSMSPWEKTVLYQTDLFLQSLGYLQGKSTISPDPKYSLKKIDLLKN